MQKITYLKQAKNLQELKKLYFELAKKHHSDITGGSDEVMKIINNEYDYLKKILKNEDNIENKFKESTSSLDSFKYILDILLKYPKLKLEIIGSWVWISGIGTFTIKDDILYNTLHCDYSKSNKKFYWYEGIENKSQKNYKGGFLNKAIEKFGVNTMYSEKQFAIN